MLYACVTVLRAWISHVHSSIIVHRLFFEVEANLVKHFENLPLNYLPTCSCVAIFGVLLTRAVQ